MKLLNVYLKTTFCLLLFVCYSHSMDSLSCDSNSINSEKPRGSIARFVIEEKGGSQVTYIDNPKAPFFFKLIDNEGRESHLLLTIHNKPIESLHPKVIEIFEKKTSLCVGEPKPYDIQDALFQLDAFLDRENPFSPTIESPLPESFFEGMEEYKPLLTKLKPWAVLAVRFTLCKPRFADGMDDTFSRKAKEYGYGEDGLETGVDVVKALKLQELTLERVIELSKEETSKPSISEEIDEINFHKSLNDGDLIGFEVQCLKSHDESDPLLSIESVGRRNETWFPRMVTFHNENKGNVFFNVGAAHGIGLKGLLHLLKDVFKIYRLTNEGEFLPFEYMPAEMITSNSF